MRKKKSYWLLRLSLFGLILVIGTTAMLLADENTGLALADLTNRPVELITRSTVSNNLYAVVKGERAGLYLSENNGQSWQQIGDLPRMTTTALAVHPFDSHILYAGTQGDLVSGSGLWYSKNQGKTWIPYEAFLPITLSDRMPVISTLAADPNHPGLFYVGTEGHGLYRLDSDRPGFEPIGGDTLSNLYVTTIIAVPDAPVYAVTTEGVVAIEGAAWHKLDSLPDAPDSLAVDPKNPDTLYVGTVGYGLFRSTDGGKTWQTLNNGLGWQPGIILDVPAAAVDSQNPKHITLTTAFGVGSHLAGDGIYESFNAGENWVKITDTPDVIKQLTIADGSIFAITKKGLRHYGVPAIAATLPETAQLQLDSLFPPTPTQLAIFILTVATAGWVLLGPITPTLQPDNQP